MAPKGYSYLLVCGGRGTIAACLFADFHNEKLYVERTLDFFRARTGLKMKSIRRFGGAGKFDPPRAARRGNLLFAGEAAGFQDAFWGFGMRYANVSGCLAAQALPQNQLAACDTIWKRRFGGMLRTSLVNRCLFERLGERGNLMALRQSGSRSRSSRIASEAIQCGILEISADAVRTSSF